MGFFEEANIKIITKLVRREVSTREKINMQIWQGHRFVGRGGVEEMLGVILSEGGSSQIWYLCNCVFWDSTITGENKSRVRPWEWVPTDGGRDNSLVEKKWVKEKLVRFRMDYAYGCWSHKVQAEVIKCRRHGGGHDSMNFKGLGFWKRKGGETVLRIFMVFACLPAAPCRESCLMPHVPMCIAISDWSRGSVWPTGCQCGALAGDLSPLKGEMSSLDSVLGSGLWNTKRICCLIAQADAENKRTKVIRMDLTQAEMLRE